MNEQSNNENEKKIKKEISLIIKENKRLHAELKTKNESLATLINQNFTDLKTLQEKHDNIVSLLSTNYNKNVDRINKEYGMFKNSINAKIKDRIFTNYKLNNEQVQILTKHNGFLTTTINQLQCDNMVLEEKINNLNNINNKVIDELKTEKSKFAQQCSDLEIAQDDISRKIESIKSLTIERDSIRLSQQDFHNKHLLLLNDNVLKQSNIDEKTLEILSLNSKITELDSRHLLHESSKTELNIKMTELINRIDSLQFDVLSTNKINKQLEEELASVTEERDIYFKDMENYKLKLRELELIMLDQIKRIQDDTVTAKEIYILEHENITKTMQEQHDKQLSIIKSETNASLIDKEKQIDGLTSYLKSLVDNQYLTLNEIEKLKITNDKLKSDNNNVDQRINEVHSFYKKELDELKLKKKHENDSLIENYVETIKKSQELNDALQHRLNQTVETLSISKTTISNLKETNGHLEKQIQKKEFDDDTIHDRYNQLRLENQSLREKLERSIELNNNFSSKEKQYELQLGQLRSKFIALTKKNMTPT